eukprot:5076604-Amphidinium_carterae.1
MYVKVCSPDSEERGAALTQYCEAHQSLTASNPKQSCELLEATLQEGCFASNNELTAITMMLLAAAHGAMGNKKRRSELYEKVCAKCRWRELYEKLKPSSDLPDVAKPVPESKADEIEPCLVWWSWGWKDACAILGLTSDSFQSMSFDQRTITTVQIVSILRCGLWWCLTSPKVPQHHTTTKDVLWAQNKKQ